MEYKLLKNKIEIDGKNDFNIEHILECGQVFSYLKNNNYIVFSGDYKCEIIERKNGFEILTKNPKYFENYFDLKTNYSEIKNKLNSKNIMQKPIKYGYGIRILKQDLFEVLISFIVSANNNIKRIKMILFHRKYEKLREFEREQLGDSPKALENGNLSDYLEKHDTLALILSALITIVPIALVFLCLISAIGYFCIVH